MIHPDLIMIFNFSGRLILCLILGSFIFACCVIFYFRLLWDFISVLVDNYRRRRAVRQYVAAREAAADL